MPVQERRDLNGTVRPTSGRAAYIGVSNLPGRQIATLAGLLGDDRLVAHRIRYGLLVREAEWEIVPATAAAGLGALA